MKKVLLAMDGAHFSRGAFEFAYKLNDITPLLLIGTFLPKMDFSPSWNEALLSGSVFEPTLEGYSDELVKENIALFEKECVRKHIEYRVHKVTYYASLQDLRKETRFADLLILGSEKFYENRGTETPNEYLKMALHSAECPVLLIPEHSYFPENIVLAYDGSEQATFAIKSFCNLMPELSGKNAILVYAVNNENAEIPDMQLVEELVARHFVNLTIHTLKGASPKHFDAWIAGIEKPMLVCGSYSRTTLSELFRKSFATEVITGHGMPVFIAHE
ncbi:universal stress protein [Chitinophaga polysaccharea]|uniref:universal stress protein n=1 Tax=Chitinophaga TaxID=79328 RepID=UPI0014552469|nr:MULTISPECIES: universal stress protein [Chitinophaga]NLR57493.1 universal stress protein [Chitinophaga polysaccharea]NLU95407.1 universal stress protein [Chitinophaga sp. Ak27]